MDGRNTHISILSNGSEAKGQAEALCDQDYHRSGCVILWRVFRQYFPVFALLTPFHRGNQRFRSSAKTMKLSLQP